MRRLAVWLAVSALATCGGVDVLPSDAGPLGRVSFRAASDVQMSAAAEGVLGGDPGTGCLWFESSGQRVPLVVEHDSAYADFTADPAVVRDGDEVWAELGQHVRLGGGHAGVDEAVPACADGGAPFLTSYLRAVGPGPSTVRHR
jgi:hypothetical protein